MRASSRRLPLWGTILLCFIAISLIGFLLARFACDEKWFAVMGHLVVAAVLAVGGCIAYHQLTTIQGTQRAAVLTSLDSCWMSSDMQDCRTAFLEFENEIKRTKGRRRYETFVKERLRNMKTADEIRYRRLMRMVEFLEGVAYFCRMKYISVQDAIGLYGPSISGNNKMFRHHIIELQQRAKDTSVYCNFLWLADRLEP